MGKILNRKKGNRKIGDRLLTFRDLLLQLTRASVYIVSRQRRQTSTFFQLSEQIFHNNDRLQICIHCDI